MRTFTNHAPLLQPLEYFPLVNISGRGGAVLYTGMAARDMSGDPKGNWRFLEGCMRLAIDGGELEILSDGTVRPSGSDRLACCRLGSSVGSYLFAIHPLRVSALAILSLRRAISTARCISTTGTTTTPTTSLG